MKKYIYLLLFLIGLLILQSSSCRAKKDCINSLKFEIPFAVTPQERFKIGDTIWIESIVSDTMLDLNTNQLIKTDNLNLATGITLSKIDTNQVNIALNHFNILEKEGSIRIVTPGVMMLNYDTLQSKQKIKLGFIPKRIGLYHMILDYYKLNFDKNLKLTNSDCQDVLMMTYRTNHGNCNYAILKQSRIDSLSEQEYVKYGSYGFEVIPR